MTAAVVLLTIVVLYRILLGIAGSADLQWLHNFAPVAAIALCGAVYLPRRIAWALPLAMLFVSDLVLNLFHYPAHSGMRGMTAEMLSWDILPRYAALALITGLGFLLRGRVGLPGLLLGSAGGSVIFYVVTNTGSWLADPGYAKNAAGWVQALTIGLPGLPPTWWFYRHTVVSDLVFTALFVACMRMARAKAEAPALASSRGLSEA